MTRSHKSEAALGEKIVQTLFRLLQMVKIHQANNRLFIESIADFRETLGLIFTGGLRESVSLRIYRGRFYLNEERVTYSPSIFRIANLLIDYLRERELRGLRFYETDAISDQEVAAFVRLLNLAGRQDNPVSWLQVQLDTNNRAWVELLTDHDFKFTAQESELEDLAQRTYHHAITSMARKTYSNALTSIVGLSGQLAAKKRVGIQKAKRVIQSMIEILTEDESILMGMSTIRAYDDHTYIHSVNVAILSMCLGRRLGLPRTAVERLGLCGLFHDLGKVDVPIDLIKKPGGFTDDEFEEVKRHPLNSVCQIIGLNADHVLKAKLLLPPFEHHLGVDLSGYPQTDRREPLSLSGRILAVADQYDALTSSRAYRPAPISPDIALKMMVEEAGAKLDPLILKVFIDMLGIYPVGSLLLLDSREVGLVVETPDNTELGRPVVRLLTRGADDRLKAGGLADLSERDEKTGRFKRNIVKCFHPTDYGLQPAEYLF